MLNVFPILINWTSPFPILGLLGGVCSFLFVLKYTSVSNIGEPNQTPHSAASELGLHCLPMSHKKDARLIWVNLRGKVTVHL